MRTLRLLTAAALLAPAVGCSWMEKWRKNDPVGPKPTGKIPDVTPDQLVSYLNDRAARLQSIEYGNTRMLVSGNGLPVRATLDGNLAAAQPRNFRMVGSGRVAASKVDMGSNTDQFWVYVAAPGDAPLYVFASHTDFETGKAKMPGGIPFEPEWVMQALGMTTFPPTNQYTVAVNERDRTYTLGWPTTTPTGLAIRKEVVFDADSATGTRPQVKKHVMREARGNKVLASAEIKSVQSAPAGTDPRTGLASSVQYPTNVVLKWEEQKFEMDLTLEKAQVNATPADDPGRRGLFARPDHPGVRAIDLAKYEFPPMK